MPSIKVVGIDPSLRNVGIAHGEVDLDTFKIDISRVSLSCTEKSKKKGLRVSSDDFDRARAHYGNILMGCTGKSFAMVEMPIGSQSASGMKSYGVSIGLVACLPIPVTQVTPEDVKLASIGSKTASKQDVIDWAHGLYPNAEGWLTKKVKGVISLTAANEHIADAIAAIHAGVKSDEFQQAVRAARAFNVA